jgi:hypothetical protein
VKEVAQTSKDLSALGTIGLAALDFFAQAGSAPDDWKTRQLAAIEQIKAPKVQVLLMPAPAVQKLIEAVSRGGSCSSLKP